MYQRSGRACACNYLWVPVCTQVRVNRAVCFSDLLYSYAQGKCWPITPYLSLKVFSIPEGLCCTAHSFCVKYSTMQVFLISNRHFQTQYFKFPPLTTKKHMPTHANQGVNLSLSLSLDLSIYLSIYVSAVLLIQRGCLERYGLSQFKDLGETWILSPKVTSRAIHEQVASRANRASHKRGT